MADEQMGMCSHDPVWLCDVALTRAHLRMHGRQQTAYKNNIKNGGALRMMYSCRRHKHARTHMNRTEISLLHRIIKLIIADMHNCGIQSAVRNRWPNTNRRRKETGQGVHLLA